MYFNDKNEGIEEKGEFSITVSASDWKMHEKYDPAVGNNYDVCMIRVNEDFVQRIRDNGDELEIPCLGKFNQTSVRIFGQ